MMATQADNYFNFLKTQVEINDAFDDILYPMYKTPFIAYVPRDDSRVSDGLALRRRYKGPIDILECSVLEVVIALAIRMENEYIGDPSINQIKSTFIRLIDNLGLIKNKNNIYERLNMFVKRAYAPNGVGGLFPLKRTLRDQRDVDLWGQMNEWISENYIY